MSTVAAPDTTLFAYRAVAANGEVVEGELDAPSRDAAVERLRRRGLLPIRVDAGGRSRRTRGRRPWGAPSRRDVTVLTRELATLLEAGLTLDAALGVLSGLAHAQPVRRLILQLRDEIRGGSFFADALANARGAFPSYYLGMVRAGEAGGSLDRVLRQVADLMEDEQRVREQIRSALVYPILLLVMCVGAIAIFVMVVLPQFEPLFADSGIELPVITRFLMSLHTTINERGWLIILALFALLLLLRVARGSEAVALAQDSLRLRLPLFGPLVAKTETARLARTLSVLLRNGVPVLAALGIARQTLGNRVLSDALARTQQALEAGGGLAEPLAATGRFPPLAVHLVTVGERSGRLDEMLGRLAQILEREAMETTGRLLTLLVPVLTIATAVVIALVIGSILSALLSVYDIPR
jgi:general secretion pathway protein F